MISHLWRVAKYMSTHICLRGFMVRLAGMNTVDNKELFFKALADKTRLRLLNLMGADEVCVCFFVEVLKTNQPKISRHLAYLRRAGIVTARRDGPWMHYRIAQPSDADAARVLNDTLTWLANDRDMQRDKARFVKVCCAPQLPIAIQGAPRPASLAGSHP